MRLTIDPSAPARGIYIPAEYIWFAEGWNGFVFKVDEDQGVYAMNSRSPEFPQGAVMWNQAYKIRSRIEDVIIEMNGLADFINYGLSVGYLRWSETNGV
jgi:hypothetical protein